MTKGAKSTATIRRRKIRYSSNDLDRVRINYPSAPPSEYKETEDEGYMFDDEVLGPSIIKAVMSSEKTLFLALISLRVVNSLFIQTHFVPDEYWQSLEVSHNMAFGYGYLTWEWQHGLRGYLYPSIFAFLYKFLEILRLDHRLLLIKLPRIIQGVIAAWGDLYLYRLSKLLCDRGTAQWTLLCQVSSWFMLYCTTRTLTNSTETVFVTVALYYFPWPGKKSGSIRTFLIFAALSVLIRPTAAIIWILLCSWHLQQSIKHIVRTVRNYVIVGLGALFLSAVVDRLFYGKWTCVQYNFLEFNVLSGEGSIYGTHPWHWYISQGYPVVMATHIFPFVVGAWKAKNKVLLFVIIWTIFMYSFLPHKEFRFLMPILPLSFHYCGVYFQSLCKRPRLRKREVKKAYTGPTDNRYGSQDSLLSSVDGSESVASSVTEISSDASKVSSENSSKSDSGVSRDQDTASDKAGGDGPDPDVDQDEEETDIVSQETIDSAKKRDLTTNELIAELEKKRKDTHKHNLSKAKIFVIILLITNIPVALYFCLIHQRGTVLVMKYLHDESVVKKVDILFLMPCHSTPYYSYLHRNVSMRFLTCEPNLKHVDNYTDEADIFYQDPLAWLKKEYSASSRPWPSHLVYFNSLQGNIDMFLSQSGYKQCASFFHSHLPEGRVGSHVLVSCR